MGIISFFTQIPSVTFGVTVCNEEHELERLLSHLCQHIHKNDEIIVLQDVTDPHAGVSTIIEKFKPRVIHIEDKLNHDFSRFKNSLIKHATKDYLFQIDADEIPAITLLKKLHHFLRRHHKFDCFCVPRINIVHGIDETLLKKWNWKQNSEGYVNFPDYQMRLFKTAAKEIVWKNKVHEELHGFKRLMDLPIESYNYCLWHEKTVKKQIHQNDSYESNF
ncbi:glycosyltransferase [Sphingobacterium chungjuense]|uniref:glycosyltransferase n=1 Tax=Sphingobacterium chungjuense TaxID=2675553 RepID=UPI00140957F9|nr:glycosyltransferase [Sphingobacterium chungjuense]